MFEVFWIRRFLDMPDDACASPSLDTSDRQEAICSLWGCVREVKGLDAIRALMIPIRYHAAHHLNGGPLIAI